MDDYDAFEFDSRLALFEHFEPGELPGDFVAGCTVSGQFLYEFVRWAMTRLPDQQKATFVDRLNRSDLNAPFAAIEKKKGSAEKQRELWRNWYLEAKEKLERFRNKPTESGENEIILKMKQEGKKTPEILAALGTTKDDPRYKSEMERVRKKARRLVKREEEELPF